ncbi:hypothetical protein BWZ20_13730 [Winogradskyella sp. J14-2]|uniref:T9SS type A sorting domain-containing protein n=1 Tax=Winogradskyella sp. J14-2 TaxID=1936080 RepID=UPI000972E586|nr:T9SS type A sorting domain-containing protein [Winogradskyella sp. J14-2]APY09295.1 hypothetical protein BWZ20_13730 [Winogradskyella sp. J14-2]
MKILSYIIFTVLVILFNVSVYAIDSKNLKKEKLEDSTISNCQSSSSLNNNLNIDNRKEQINTKPNNLTSLGQLRLSLYESSALANNEAAADGVLILFDSNGNNDVDANDAPDIPNLDENFSTNNNGVLLSIESRAAPVDLEEIQLEVNTYRSTSYTIVAEGISIQNAIAFLYDDFTGISTEIPQSGTISYNYSINTSDAQSLASDRFRIVFDVETLSDSISSLEEISIYPNPTRLGKFYLYIPSEIHNLNISIYNILGTKLYAVNRVLQDRTITIVTDDVLSAGTYIVELKSQGKTIVKKLIVL